MNARNNELLFKFRVMFEPRPILTVLSFGQYIKKLLDLVSQRSFHEDRQIKDVCRESMSERLCNKWSTKYVHRVYTAFFITFTIDIGNHQASVASYKFPERMKNY